MKKILCTVLGLSLFFVLSCKNGIKNDEDYYAENNIQEICPELKKQITKSINKEDDAFTFITEIANEYSAIFNNNSSSSSSRVASTKPVSKASDAKKQIIDFYVTLVDVLSYFEVEDSFTKDISFDQEINVAEVETSDVVESVLDEFNKQLKIQITESDLTEEQKTAAYDEQCITVEKIKNKITPQRYDILTSSIALDRYFCDLEFSIKDTDKDKAADYANVNSEILYAGSIKNFNEVVNILSDPLMTDDQERVEYPVKAIAWSVSGNAGGECTVKDEKATVNNADINFDISLSIAAVTKKGVGSYVTLSVKSTLLKNQVKEFIQACIDDNVSEKMLNTFLGSLGEISIKFNNGKADNLSLRIGLKDLGKKLPMGLQGVLEAELN